MTEHKGQELETALAVARIRAIRTVLLALHKALLDVARARHEREHGPIAGPHAVLRLVLDDPGFQWLRPMAALIVTADERLATDVPVVAEDARAFARDVRDLLRGDQGGVDFRREYQRVLQEVPDVVVLHGRILGLVTEALV